MGSTLSREALSRHRQAICQLNERRWKITRKLLYPKAMVGGSLSLVYRSCGTPNCCCQKGKKHGPFWALSLSVEGRRTTRMVKKAEAEQVREKALAYRSYQQHLALVRKLSKQMDAMLGKIRGLFLEGYP